MTGRTLKKAMSNLSAPQDKADGCELPEQLRRYYLDTMGIQLWQELSAKAEPVTTLQAVAGEKIAAPVTKGSVHESVVETQSGEITKQPDVSVSNWSELQTRLQQCDQCGLQASRSQVIFGVGDQQANLLIVSEAPNQEEDALGLLLIGEAGDLMTAMLKAIGLQKSAVYISSIIKCHTPDNRKPLAQEIQNCDLYLRRQIELLQPKVIYAAGAMAAQALLNTDESISLLRQRQHDFNGIPLIASFHPAYLLRKPSEKRKAWQDLLQIKSLLSK